MNRLLSFFMTFILLMAPQVAGSQPVSGMSLESSDFKHAGTIPERFTCKGLNVSPDLAWQGAPAGTKSFVLIMEDPDARSTPFFTHWVIYNIPASATRLASGTPAEIPQKLTSGKNDAGKTGYYGPCPPKNDIPHRYYFMLYALDTPLNLPTGATKEEVKTAMHGHTLAQTQLVGMYGKK